MIIVDTNVISEPMRKLPEPAVLDWLDRQPRQTLFTTATSYGELLAGAALLPQGKRKNEFLTRIESTLLNLFEGRVLAFDRDAATSYALIVAAGRKKGHVISIADAQIAAIARCRGFAIATRDVRPFEAAGITVINPWLH